MTDRIGIVGGGIAGLTAAYLLNEKYDITLFEKSYQLGGNAYTHMTKEGIRTDVCVAAYSKLVSKNFFKLLKKLNVKKVRQPGKALLSIVDMDTNEGIYLTPYSLKGLFAQKFALFGPKTVSDLWMTNWLMHKTGKLYKQGKMEGLTVREALALVPGLEGIRLTLMMVPLCLLSSMYYEEILDSPAEFFFKKVSAFKNFHPYHQMYGLYFPKNYTKSYVDALASHYEDKIILNSTIKAVIRDANTATVVMEDGSKQVFEKIVFACNADQALALLENPTDDEKRLLGAWKYHDGLMVVHKDGSSLPKRALCQTWTCLQSTENGRKHFSITGCAWRGCPAIPNDAELYSVQYPNYPIRDDLIELKKTFRTPIFDFKSSATIEHLPSLNGKMNSYYCGSHFGMGLHNDAVTSAIEVAKNLGIEWE